MTDEQIEEALKHCPAHTFNHYCSKCALNGVSGCRNELMLKAIDYIERLKKTYSLPCQKIEQ